MAKSHPDPCLIRLVRVHGTRAQRFAPHLLCIQILTRLEAILARSTLRGLRLGQEQCCTHHSHNDCDDDNQQRRVVHRIRNSSAHRDARGEPWRSRGPEGMDN